MKARGETVFTHTIDDKNWTVRVSQYAVEDGLASEGVEPNGTQEQLDDWVERNMPRVTDAAEGKVRAGGGRDSTVVIGPADIQH